MKLYHLPSFTSFTPPENHVGLPKACKKKNLSCHNLRVIFVTNEEAAMCLCLMHHGAGEGSNFLQSSSDFVPLALCAIRCFTVPGRFCGNFGLQCSVANLCADTVDFYKWNTFTWKDDS